MARKPRFDPAINWEEIRREWRARVVAEYHSSAFTAELLHVLIRIGAPYDLLLTAHRIVKDELIHSERSFGVLRAVGGEDSLVTLTEETLKLPLYSEHLFEQATCVALQTFCLGETFAVPLFRAMYRKTTHPQAQNTLRRILKDESVHREFGWQLLDYLLTRDEARVKAIAGRFLVGFLAEYERGYGLVPEGSEEHVGEKERAFGLMPRAEYASVFQETLSRVIFPRFTRRQIDARGLWVKHKAARTEVTSPPQ